MGNSFLKMKKFGQHDGVKFRLRMRKFISKIPRNYVPRSPNWAGRFCSEFYNQTQTTQKTIKNFFSGFLMLRVAKNRKMCKIEQKHVFFQRIKIFEKLNMRIFFKFLPLKNLIIWQNIQKNYKNLPASSWETDTRKFCVLLRKFCWLLRNFATPCCPKFLIFKKLFPMILWSFHEILRHFWVLFVENG